MNVGFKSPVTVGSEPAERGLDLRTYLNFLWRNWMFIGALVALSLLVGIVYLVRATPLYTATVQILLDPSAGKKYRCGRRLSPFPNLRLRDDGKPIIDHQFRSTVAPRRHQRSNSPLPRKRTHRKTRMKNRREAQRIQDADQSLAGSAQGKARRAIQRIRYFNHLARSQASRPARQCGRRRLYR